jgi:hypothetical protein
MSSVENHNNYVSLRILFILNRRAQRTKFLRFNHRFDPINLRRVSRALAFQRFNGTHNNEKITELLHEIHSKYGLNSFKVVATIIVNGSNFIKAFKRFGVRIINVLVKKIVIIVILIVQIVK